MMDKTINLLLLCGYIESSHVAVPKSFIPVCILRFYIRVRCICDDKFKQQVLFILKGVLNND